MKKKMSASSMAKWLCAALALLFFGCATNPVYRVEVGARTDAYQEKPQTPLDQAIGTLLGTKVTTTSGDPNLIKSTGYGGHVGIVEYSGPWVSRISAFYTSYQALSYQFQILSNGARITETLNPYALGVDAAIGYQFLYFIPRVSYKLQSFGTKTSVLASGSGGTATTSLTESETQFLIGGGLTIDYPITSSFSLALDGDYRVPLNAKGTSVREMTFQAGLRFGTSGLH